MHNQTLINQKEKVQATQFLKMHEHTCHKRRYPDDQQSWEGINIISHNRNAK